MVAKVNTQYNEGNMKKKTFKWIKPITYVGGRTASDWSDLLSLNVKNSNIV